MSAPEKPPPTDDGVMRAIKLLEERGVELTDALLADQQIEQMINERRQKEAECEASGGHERVATKDTRWGWHEGHCSKCGKNMDYDSGD